MPGQSTKRRWRFRDQVALLREAIRNYLRASYVARLDKGGAE